MIEVSWLTAFASWPSREGSVAQGISHARSGEPLKSIISSTVARIVMTLSVQGLLFYDSSLNSISPVKLGIKTFSYGRGTDKKGSPIFKLLALVLITPHVSKEQKGRDFELK